MACAVLGSDITLLFSRNIIQLLVRHMGQLQILHLLLLIVDVRTFSSRGDMQSCINKNDSELFFL